MGKATRPLTNLSDVDMPAAEAPEAGPVAGSPALVILPTPPGLASSGLAGERGRLLRLRPHPISASRCAPGVQPRLGVGASAGR